MTRLLLLEDDERVARGIGRITATLGHEAVHSPTVTGAKQALQTEHFDLIIADLGLENGESGLDFLNWARAEFPHVRRVLTSGAMQPAEYPVEPPLQLFLHKPFGKTELAEILATTPASGHATG